MIAWYLLAWLLIAVWVGVMFGVFTATGEGEQSA